MKSFISPQLRKDNADAYKQRRLSAAQGKEAVFGFLPAAEVTELRERLGTEFKTGIACGLREMWTVEALSDSSVRLESDDLPRTSKAQIVFLSMMRVAEVKGYFSQKSGLPFFPMNASLLLELSGIFDQGKLTNERAKYGLVYKALRHLKKSMLIKDTGFSLKNGRFQKNPAETGEFAYGRCFSLAFKNPTPNSGAEE